MTKTQLARLTAVFALCITLLGLTGCAGSGINGQVFDAETNAVLEGSRITTSEMETTSDAQGAFTLKLPLGTHSITVSRAGYAARTIEYTLDKQDRWIGAGIPLTPRKLSGIVSDASTNTPVAGAALAQGETTATTDAQGAFNLSALTDAPVTISRAGFISATLDAQQVATLFDADGNLIKELELQLTPRTVSGSLREEGSGAPLVDTTVQIGSQSAKTDAMGSFGLAYVEPGDAITISSPGYRVPETIVYAGEPTLDLKLKPYQALVTLRDAENGELLPEATLTTSSGSVSVEADGRFLARIIPGTTITASLTGYKNMVLEYVGEEELELKLAPAQLVGQLRAADTGEPISGAAILAYTGGAEPAVLRSDEAGRFFYAEDNEVSEILIKAPGYERLTLPITRTGMLRVDLAPFCAKALYIPFGLLYDRAALEEVLDMAQGTEMNAIVVDLKDDWATLAWKSKVPLAVEIGAYNEDVIDATEIAALAHERGLYVVGRLVVFKDQQLAKAHPEYAVQRRSGGYYVDLENLMWVDPFHPEVQQYNIDLAVELANLGIDEVQYDYIRFPSDGSVEGLLYSQEATFESRTATIGEFIGKTHAALMKTPAFFSVDVFGLVPWIAPDNDMGIGQTMEAIAPNVDYLCPMLYPTTFGPGELGYANPGIYPYEIVYQSVMEAHKRTSTKIRPWLQHYTIFGIEYGPVERLQQRKAADDANSCGWTFWNAAGWYERSSIESNVYGQYPEVIGSTPENMR